MMNGEHRLMVWLLIPLLLFFTTCERRTEVNLQGGNPPTFLLSGSGNLIELSIGLDLNDKNLIPSKRSPVLWKIQPITRDGEKVESISKITYGIVPNGYKQTIPSQGSPPALSSGNYYYYYLETINAAHADGDFEIKDGKAVRAYDVRTCYRVVNGQEIESPCGDSRNKRSP